MATTLAQRIKAARNYADLRQQDIADACTLAGIKVSRSAVAQWEYDDERRTQPSIDHVKVVAKRTGVPVDWLLNDNAELADIWRFAKLSEPMPLAPEPKSPVTDRFADAYAKAVEFAVLQRKPEMASAFGRVFGHGAFIIAPDFIWGNTVIELKTSQPTTETIGRLLTTEQALSRRLEKVVITLSATPTAPHDVFGIRVYPVTSPDEAAQKIIAICE